MWLLTLALTVTEPSARCQAWGELVLLGAKDKLLEKTADVGEKAPPCERYYRATALAQTEDQHAAAEALFAGLGAASGPLGDWATLRASELRWQQRLEPAQKKTALHAPPAEFNYGFMTRLYQAALTVPAEHLVDAVKLEQPGPRRRWQLEVLAQSAPNDHVLRELFVEYPDSLQAPLAFAQATLPDLMRRAAVASDKHMNDDVLKTVAAAQKMQPSADDRCALSFYAGAAERKLRHYKLAEDALAEAVQKCPDTAPDFKKRAHFLLGQVQVIARSTAVAEPTMRRFAQLYKNDSLVDDALFNLAASAERAGDQAKALQLYELVTRSDPPGDMCAEAAFRIAYGAYKLGEFDKARDRFARIGQGLCGSDDYERARAWYWEARTRERLSEPVASVQKPLRTIIERQPLSYYALLARERLGLVQPGSASQPASLAGLPPLSATGTVVRRARELSAQGLFREAQSELDAALKDASADEQASYAPLLAEARDYYRAHMLFRTTLKGALGPLPTDATMALWQIAYPRPFAQQIADAERKEGLDEGLLLALIREESAFQLDAGSWANAYGLTQLIMDTALGTARDMKLGYLPTATMLREEPSLAITLGAHHLAMLKRKQARAPLILAAYNAGMGAVSRWLGQRGDKPMDEFIEEIPLDETRGYVKRIMRTWATYRLMQGKALPRVDLRPAK